MRSFRLIGRYSLLLLTLLCSMPLYAQQTPDQQQAPRVLLGAHFDWFSLIGNSLPEQDFQALKQLYQQLHEQQQVPHNAALVEYFGLQQAPGLPQAPQATPVNDPNQPPLQALAASNCGLSGTDTGSIQGLVTDEAGVPLANVSVTPNSYNSTYSYWNGLWNNAVQTQADGSYQLDNIPTGKVRLGFYLYSGNYISEYYDNAASVETATDILVQKDQVTPAINAQLAAGGSISGVISDSAGQPVTTGLSLQVYRLNTSGNYWSWVNNVGINTSTGAYIVNGLATGIYRVGTYTYPDSPYINNFYGNMPDVDSAADVSVTAGQDTPNINIQLALGGSISGLVTDLSGNPLTEGFARVYQWNGNYWSSGKYDHFYTQDNGQYVINGLANGTYRLKIEDRSNTYISSYYHQASTVETAADVVVVQGQDTPLMTEQLALGGSISGLVLDEGGLPLPNVQVTTYQFNGNYYDWIKSANTGSDGRYTVGGLGAGNYRIEFSHSLGSEVYNDAPHYTLGQDIAVTVGQDTPNIDAVIQQPACISGTVTDEQGQPIENVRISAYVAVDSSREISYWGVSSAATNSQGEYFLSGLFPYSYSVRFDHNYYQPEIYDNSPGFPGMLVTVQSNQLVSNINAQLALRDSDNDGLPDTWESQYGLDPNNASDASLDNDNDGYSNLEEFNGGSSPSDANDTPTGTNPTDPCQDPNAVDISLGSRQYNSNQMTCQASETIYIGPNAGFSNGAVATLTAGVSVQASSDVTVDSGAQVMVTAPLIRLLPTVHFAAGSHVHLQSTGG